MEVKSVKDYELPESLKKLQKEIIPHEGDSGCAAGYNTGSSACCCGTARTFGGNK